MTCREEGGQRRAGYDVRAELISVCGEAKAQHCEHFYLISWSRASSLFYLCLIFNAHSSAVTQMKSKEIKITNVSSMHFSQLQLFFF